MNWLNKLERKYGQYAISHLIYYIVGLQGISFILSITDPTGRFLSNIALIPNLVYQGELWRIFTFLLMPPTSSPIFIIFILLVYYMIGNTLEAEWGAFKLNVYYFISVMLTIIGAFVFDVVATPGYINMSLFLAFVMLRPNMEFRLYFLIPVKAKYLGYFYGLILFIQFFSNSIATKAMIIMSLANFLIFFGKPLITNKRHDFKRTQRKNRHNKRINHSYVLHKCAVCGITEKDDPTMTFRYCADCNYDYEYCDKHLHDHKHKNKVLSMESKKS